MHGRIMQPSLKLSMCLCSLSVSVSPEGEDIVIADVSHRG
jgi:hypothetical protein